jgi:hypothetical protein
MTEKQLQRAEDMLAKKFAQEKIINDKGDPVRPHTWYVHNINGTKVACNGYIAGVILPEDKEQWDLYDAVMIEEPKSGEKESLADRLDIGAFFRKERLSGEELSFSASLVKELIASCKSLQVAQRARHKELGIKLPKGQGNHGKETYYANIVIDFEDGRVVHQMLNNKMRSTYRVNNLQSALEFLMCAKPDSVQVFFRDAVAPLVLRAENLYALVMPVLVR